MRRTPAKPVWWKLSGPEWEWYCYRQKLGEEMVEHVVPEVPPWPGVDGAPPAPKKPAPRKDEAMKGLPWGCKTLKEYGKEYRRREAERVAQEAVSVAPVLRKRGTVGR